MKQLDLFEIAGLYAEGDSLDNAAFYRALARHLDVDEKTRAGRHPVGRSGSRRNLFERRARWYQQTLKHMGVLERVPGRRGHWRLTREGRAKLGLHQVVRPFKLLAFSTRLGFALWADCRDGFEQFDEPIALCVTSPPYPLNTPRAYGNPTEAEFVDWLCRSLEPVVRQLMPGGSIVLNLSNDIFMPKSPARSLYRERLVLALHERLGLHKMDEIPWVNRSKPPGPTWWASIQRNQLNVAWEPVYWFTNDPASVRADNREVLQAHTERHARLIGQGGTRRTAQYGDGAYRLAPGNFGNTTAGSIPKNVFERGHVCASNREYARRARELGLPVHRAVFPIDLPDFFIRFLSRESDLVVDPFAGSCTTALAAERRGRRWMATDTVWEYLRGAAERFRSSPGFCLEGSN